MFRKELYKIFIKQKGIYFLLVLLLLKVAFVVCNGYDSHYMIDENETYYLDYIHQYEGKITEQKQKKVEEEYYNINHQSDESLASFQKEKAFQVFYHQYIYEKEKGGGAILDTRGWQSILEHDDLDFLLIIYIVIITCMLFCTEYESEMDILLLSSKKGRFYTTVIKILLGILSGAVFSFLFQMVHIFYLNATVGLTHGDYLLKSLEKFEETQYAISLRSAVVLVVLMRVLGGMLLAALAMLVAVLLKKKSLSMVVGFVLILMPELLFSRESVGYYLPLPLGLCRACGYLWPDDYVAVIAEQGMERQCIFHEISKTEFAECLFFFMMQVLLFCLLCFIFFTRSCPKFLAFKKRVCCYPIILMIVYTFSGCELSHDGQENFKIEVEDAQYICQFGEGTIEIDDEKNTIIYTDGQGKEINLLRNVFPIDLSVRNIFVYGQDCYYLLENDNDSGICVRKINMDNFSDVLIYTSIEENIEDFYGLKTEDRDAEEAFENTEETKWFFVNERYIYLKKKYDIKQIDRKSGLQKIVAEQVSDGKVVYDNGKIFYKDANGKNAVYKEK